MGIVSSTFVIPNAKHCTDVYTEINERVGKSKKAGLAVISQVTYQMLNYSLILNLIYK